MEEAEGGAGAAVVVVAARDPDPRGWSPFPVAAVVRARERAWEQAADVLDAFESTGASVLAAYRPTSLGTWCTKHAATLLAALAGGATLVYYARPGTRVPRRALEAAAPLLAEVALGDTTIHAAAQAVAAAMSKTEALQFMRAAGVRATYMHIDRIIRLIEKLASLGLPILNHPSD